MIFIYVVVLYQLLSLIKFIFSHAAFALSLLDEFTEISCHFNPYLSETVFYQLLPVASIYQFLLVITDGTVKILIPITSVIAMGCAASVSGAICDRDCRGKGDLQNERDVASRLAGLGRPRFWSSSTTQRTGDAGCRPNGVTDDRVIG